MNLGSSLLIGLDRFVQQHFTDLDSVGRRCAARLRELGLATLFHSRPMPTTNGGIGQEATLGQRLNPNRACQPFVHTVIVHKAKVNGALRFFAIGDVVDRESGWPRIPLPTSE
jgi:hypothetical protein